MFHYRMSFGGAADLGGAMLEQYELDSSFFFSCHELMGGGIHCIVADAEVGIA